MPAHIYGAACANLPPTLNEFLPTNSCSAALEGNTRSKCFTREAGVPERDMQRGSDNLGVRPQADARNIYYNIVYNNIT